MGKQGTMTPVLMAILLVGCAGRRIPDHLKLDAPSAEEAAPEQLATPADALSAILGTDPLGRKPQLVEPSRLPSESDALVAYMEAIVAVERGEGDVAVVFQQVEDAWRGTAAVALARGYRLRVAESRLANPEDIDDEATQRQALELLTPIRAVDEATTPPMPPLAWLSDQRDPRQDALDYGDRWVLGAWLDGPSIPLAAVASALGGPAFDRLRDDPLGRLIAARAATSPASSADPAPGMADLRRATLLAATRAAADRDKEQASWSDLRRETGEELGADDPVDFLLARALEELLPGSADDTAAGAARLAVEARRWSATCPEGERCAALDRVDGMAAAGRFSPDVAPLARAWQVIALKDALDTMDVGHDTVLYPRAAVLLVDALLGTGAGPLSATLVRTRRPDAGVWLELGRSVGADATTDWSNAKAALAAHLEREAAAAADQVDDAELKQVLERIVKRAPR